MSKVENLAYTASPILTDNLEAALLYRQLATLRLDVPIEEDLAQLEWQGALGGLPNPLR